ncbi:MAG: hypothetical protein Kow0026_06220 [Oricola sp.]
MARAATDTSTCTTRRQLLLLAGASAIGTFGLSGDACAGTVRISATARRKCATCNFWGGSRSISADGKWVEASGKGRCGNPKSPAYKTMTKPDQGAPVWERWDALG